MIKTTLHISITLCLLLLSMTDLRQRIVPYSCLAILVVLTMLLKLVVQQTFFPSILCSIFLGGLAISLRYGIAFFKTQPGCGWGDIWLFFICGWVLSPVSLPYFLLITGVTGMIFGWTWKFCTQEIRFPFVPSISLGLIVALWLEYVDRASL